MHLFFTEKEMQYIKRIPFGWSVLKDAPKNIEESINKKIRKINDQFKINRLGI